MSFNFKREDWRFCDFEEIFEVKGGSQPPKSTFKYEEKDGYIRLLQIRDFGNKPVPTYVPKDSVTKFCNEDDVLIARYGASLGRIVTGMAGAYNVALAKVIPIVDSIFDTWFVFYMLQTTILQQPLKMISRSAQNGFAKSDIARIKTPLIPIPEQRAIVAKIEELFSDLDKGVTDLKKAQDQLKVYRQAVLKKAFEGELTKEWREENNYSLNDFLKGLKESKNRAIKEKLIAKGEYFPNYDTKSLTFNAPQNWLMLPWKTLCSNNKYAMKRGPFGSALKKAFFVEKGIVVYEQGHAINDEPFRHRYFISPEKFEELKAFETKAGDMIISCSGVTLGRICLLPDNADTGVINQALLKIDMDESIMLKNYFVQLFRSGTFQRLIFQKSLGSAMPNMVGMTELKEIPIPIPSIEEQYQILKEIESRLSVCDKVEESITKSLEKAEALRQSILKKAFEGRLLSNEEIKKCKAAPDYEPAAVLLQKIKNL